MSGSLIRRVSNASSIGYGVNIWEVAPPTAVSGQSANVIGIVADLPWGPTDQAIAITSPGELWSTFYPDVFATVKDNVAYPAILAFLNKPIFTAAGIRLVRLGATSQAKATKTYLDGEATPGDSVVATAKYAGALGNDISLAWAANATTAANRDMTVTIGSNYTATYENVVVDNVGSITVTDPGDNYVTIAAASGATDVPVAASAVALAGGSDGTAVAADYTGSSSSTKGIRVFYGASIPAAVLFVAECPASIIDTVNTALVGYVTDTEKGLAVLSTPAGQTSALAIAYPASYRSDRLSFHPSRVKTTNFFDPDAAEITVDGNAFAAAAIVSVDPWLSPGGSGGNAALTGITALEDDTWSRATLDALNAAGAAPWFISTKLGPIIRRGVNTSLTSGLTKIFRRRMTDYITNSIAAFAEGYVESQLDLVLAGQILGPNTQGFIGAIRAFLANEKVKNHIQSYAVDPFSGNVQADLDAGRMTTLISVKLFGMMEEIVLKANIGETVTISEG